MSLNFTGEETERTLDGAMIFVSASIPDPKRWKGEADALEITDAVVSLARVFLSAGASIVTAAHPTIAPLLLYVAAEMPEHGQRIVTYQSRLFKDVLPPETQRFQEEEIGQFIWTDAVPGEEPEPGKWDGSLEIMREQMLGESRPTAAVFVGGMKGIPDEFAMFSRLRPDAPTYAVGGPGGEARALAETLDSPLRTELLRSRVYPALWRTVLKDLATRQ